MEKAIPGSMDDIRRRLAAVKVVVDLLNHELDLGKADKAVSLERDRLEATVMTLEVFIGDVEQSLRATGGDDRRVSESARGPATRVS